MTPKITIGMTCFNSSDTIAEAIKSALAQTYQNKEIIIVDDGSSDGSVDVIRTAIAGQSEARLVIHPQNTGFAGALNTLIAEAKGEYLAIFDDDDISCPERIEKQLQRLSRYQQTFKTDMVVCHSARIQRYPDGTEFYEPTAGCIEGMAPHGRMMADRILIGHLSAGVTGSCANCSRMAPISAFRAVGGFDASMRRCEDTDFNVRFSLAGGHFPGIAEPLVTQTMTGGNDKTLDREFVAEKLMIDKHRAYLESRGWYDFCVRWQNVKYANLAGKKFHVLMLILLLLMRHPLQTIQKLLWAIPASRTRARMKSWYSSQTMKPAGGVP